MYDMSMSMSLSFSYSYDSQDDGTSLDDNDTNSTSSSNNTDSSGSDTTPETDDSSGPTDTTPQSDGTTGDGDGDGDTTPDPSCFGLNRTDVEALMFVQSSKESISFHVLENALDAAMREVLPFCEDLTSRVRRLNENSTGYYYVGNVDLEEAGNGK